MRNHGRSEVYLTSQLFAVRCTFVVVSVLFVLSAYARAADIEFSSGVIRAKFDERHGNITALISEKADQNVCIENRNTPLWKIDFLGKDRESLMPEHAKSFVSNLSSEGNPTLQLIWSDFGFERTPSLKVTALIGTNDKESLTWRFDASGLEDGTIRAIHFPCIPGIRRFDGETFAAPVWMGQKTTRIRELTSNADGSGRRLEWESPGILSMQFLTLYAPSAPGFYLASNDRGALRKQFVVLGDGRGGLGFEVVHLPEADNSQGSRGVGQAQGPAPTSRAFSMTYDVLVGINSGDWFDAAERYRRWANEAGLSVTGRLRRNQVPDWARNTGIWVWNRGRSPGVLEPAIALSEKSGLPVSVLWHWWHGCSYDTGFPEYLPPREGDEPFRSALKNANEKNVHAIVYLNQRLWGMTTKSWTEENAERFAVKGADGALHPEIYNIFTKAAMAPMCIGTQFWRDKYAGIAEKAIRGLGVNGIYMDQACSSMLCFDLTHGHPIGGGNYWIGGFQLLASDIRMRCNQANTIALAGEGCGESWLPHLDLMLSLQVSMERAGGRGDWEPLPMFQAVYHDSAIQFGNYSSLTVPPYDDLWPAEFAPKEPLKLLDRKFSQQFRLEQARAFVWGQQPTIANFQVEQFEKRAEETAFVLKLAKLRAKLLPYLRDGVFLRPPDIDAHAESIPMSRLSIYAGQQDHVREFERVAPRVLSSAWRSQSGNVAVVFVNISDEPTKVPFQLKHNGYALPMPSRVYAIDASSEYAIGEYTGGNYASEITIALEGATAIEFRGH
jgi:hypothetical protein